MEPNKVVQALRVLQEEGREDLIKKGVLEHARVGLKRPKRSSAEGVTAAILACTSPEKSPKKFWKFKSKSVSGRKVSVSTELLEHVEQSLIELPVVRPIRRGGVRVSRRSGASLRQRVAAVGRGSLPAFAVQSGCQEVACSVTMRALSRQCAPQGAVSLGDRMGVLAVSARAAKHMRALKNGSQQAPLAVESGGTLQAVFRRKNLRRVGQYGRALARFNCS
ncbi:hypothetical protein NDU88_000297 [Pleurodeles waltl]|uniref:Uncharacterized protein n=1 Tax=Pleurodeles waltl TaxID=8319 RepID=A0AAV7VT26_PLEWA|nr:hypothetical protein NDU88_000297 [Pleurodeles waltl]